MKKCNKTTSGKHIWEEKAETKWGGGSKWARGYRECKACGVIDDKNYTKWEIVA